MDLREQICTKSDCYKANRKITVKGLMLHSVGCNQPDPNVFYNTWNKSGWNVCAHAVLGADGVVIQTLPWNCRGWHGGGSSNDSYIGVEMTEPRTITYTSGANWNEMSDGKNTEAHVRGTYTTAVELFAFLCKKYNLNPLGKNVIVSHSEGYKLGIASGHADVEHIWGKFGLSMDKFRQDVKTAMENLTTGDNAGSGDVNIDVDTSNLTKIAGQSVATIEQMKAYAISKGAPEEYANLAVQYIGAGNAEGIRGDVAFAQSLLETGYFSFGGDVSSQQNNFAGLGATGNGVHGEAFETEIEGIRAQIQHLKAYANTEPLNGECVDTRFKYVERGCAPYVEWLGQKENPNGKGWATAPNYGGNILTILNNIINYKVDSDNGEGTGEDEPMYRVMLDWNDKESQIGAFKNLDYAKKLVESRPEYKVFDANGKCVYFISVVPSVVDTVVEPYTVNVPAKTPIYSSPTLQSAVVSEIAEKGIYTIVAENAIFGKLKSGAGYINLNLVEKTTKEADQPYTVKVTTNALNIRRTPGGQIVSKITDRGIYTIVATDGEWGKLKSGAGWINLKYTQRT